MCVAHQNLRIAQLLLAFGANVDVKDKVRIITLYVLLIMRSVVTLLVFL